MIEDFIESALIIDEKSEEVQELIKLLEEKDIYVSIIFP